MRVSSLKSRKHCGKRRNYFSRAISHFPTAFSKGLYCRHIKRRACLGKGYLFTTKSFALVKFKIVWIKIKGSNLRFLSEG